MMAETGITVNRLVALFRQLLIEVLTEDPQYILWQKMPDTEAVMARMVSN